MHETSLHVKINNLSHTYLTVA